MAVAGDLYIEHDSKTPFLDARQAFSSLSHREQLYSYHVARASWSGDLIAQMQCSGESLPLYVVLQRLFRSQGSVANVKALAGSLSISDFDLRSLLVFAASFFDNCGNYKSFGDTHFIPQVPKAVMRRLIEASQMCRDDPAMLALWNDIEERVFDSETKRAYQLGFKPEGVSTYFSYNCTDADGTLVKSFLLQHGIDGYNTRAIKTVDGSGKAHYEIRYASALPTTIGEQLDGNEMGRAVEFGGATWTITRGDFAPMMEKIAYHLGMAAKYSANETEKVCIIQIGFIEIFSFS